MATSNGNRDVTLAVGIKTSGEDALRNLAGEVQNLAKRGGDAAPAYQHLADELSRLAQQAGQLEAFKALAADVERLTAEQTAAASAASELAAKLELQRKAVVDATTAENAAQVELKATKEALQGKRFALEQLNIDTDRASKGEAAYIESSRKLKQAILELKTELVARKAAMSEAASAVDAAEAAEGRLVKQYDASAKAAGQIGTALAAQRDVMTRTVAAAEQLGLSITDVARAEEHLLTTQQKLVGGVADARIAAAREQAAADRQAITEAQGLAELYERGRVALIAETAAINEAAEASKRHAAFQKDVAAEVTRLVTAEQQAAQAMRDTAAATTKANEAALALAANADQIRFYAQAFDQLAEREREAAAEAERLRTAGARAAEALKEAFGTTGVRSLQAVQTEVAKVGQSLNLLEANYRAGAISARDLERATSSAQVRLAQLRQEALTVPSLPNVFERINSSINDLIGKFGSLGAAVATVGFAVKPVIDANVQLEQLRRTLTGVTGSASEAEKQIGFLRATADANGLAVGKLSSDYSTFVSALLKSGISLKDTQTLFGGVAAASNAMGLSTERASLVLLALAQSASKGKVSLEEVQSQIGESLPGALKLMADSLGITTAEFTKLVTSGKLLTEDFLPRFGQQLQKTFGGAQQPIDGLQQAFAKLQNRLTLFYQSLADTSAYKGLVSIVQGLTSNFDTLTSGLGALTRAFIAFKAIDIAREFFGIKAAAEASAAAKLVDAEATARLAVVEKEANLVRTEAAAVVARETVAIEANTVAKASNAAASRAASTAMLALETGFAKTVVATQGAVSRIGSLAAALGGLPGVVLAVTVAFSDKLGGAIAYFAAKVTGAIGTIEKFDAAQKKSADAAKASAAKQVEASALLERSVAQELIAYQKRTDAASVVLKVAEEEVKTKKLLGEASVHLAELAGNEAAALQAAARAAGENETAARNVVIAKQALVDVLKAEVEATIKAAGGVDKLSAARKEEIQRTRDKITEAEADIRTMKAQAEALGVTADRAFLSAQATKDLSTSIDDLRRNVESARINLEALTAAQKQGLATQDAVALAARDLAAAQGLVAKALNDTVAARQREVAETKLATDTANLRIDLARREVQIATETARLNGQVLNTQADLIVAKQKEIAAIREKVGLATREIDAEAALLRAKREAIIGTDKEAAARRADIDLQLRQLELKRQGLSLSEKEITLRQAEINAMQRMGDAGSLSSEKIVAGTERELEAREKANAAVQRAIDLENKRRGVDSAGFAADDKGNRIGVELPTFSSILQQAKSAGLTDAQAQAIASRGTDSNGNYRFNNNPLQLDAIAAGRSGATASAAIAYAIEKALRDAQAEADAAAVRERVAPKTTKTDTTSTATSSAASTSSGNGVAALQPINIYIDRVLAGSLNVGGGADVATLQQVLTQLVQSSGRAA